MNVKTIFPTLALLILAAFASAQIPPLPAPPTASTNREMSPDNPLMRAMMARTNRTLAKPTRGPVAAPAADSGAATPANAQPAGAAQTDPASATPAPEPIAPGVQPPAPKPAAQPEEVYPVGAMNFPAAPLDKMLELYATFVGRTVLRHPQLPKEGTITLIQTTPLTKTEVIQALEAAMAMNNISLVKVGEKFLKVVPTASVPGAAPKPDNRPASELNELGNYVTHIVQLRYAKPSELMTLLTPFATPGMPPSLPIDSTQMLILRDNEENVKRMLEMVEKIDVNIPAEIVSEVIPIKFAKAEDIASALNSISGGGSSSTFGQRSAGGTSGGTGGAFGRSGSTGGFGQRTTTPNTPGQPVTGAPSSGSTFSDRINQIINRAATPGSASGDIQLIGPNKIIADVRANSLLVFATRDDLRTITNIISKLDVVLQQVMIETIIMDVSLDNDWNLGVSAAQRQRNFSKNGTNSLFAGVGGFNNGQSFFDFLASGSTNLVSSLPSGSSYFGQIGLGPTFDIAIQAAATDSRISVIQKPRIMTSHAKTGRIFLGETRPTVQSTYYGGGFNGGPSSSYAQLEVGIGLNVTPYINADGLVVMEIQQEINEISGTTQIVGVGEVPNTTKRQLEAEVAVLDGESIMLGGYIRNRDNTSKQGVPLLKDIPLLGKLFSSSSSKKGRSELVVLMRPTVLRTPEEAAKQTAVEKAKMPGVREAEKRLEEDERKTDKPARRKVFFKDVSQPADRTAPAHLPAGTQTP